jgi:hypothetical protein
LQARWYTTWLALQFPPFNMCHPSPLLIVPPMVHLHFVGPEARRLIGIAHPACVCKPFRRPGMQFLVPRREVRYGMHAESEKPREEAREVLKCVARFAVVSVCDKEKVALGGYVKQVVDDGVGRFKI